MEKQVLEFINTHRLTDAGNVVGVAVSGGADSMAMMACLKNLSEALEIQVVCVHFEHGIRGEESLRDAEFVAEYCEKWRVPFYMGAADVPALSKEWKVSVELAAKRAREAYFAEMVADGTVDLIATAHHKEDTAESVLMHVLRGTGIDGLIGIRRRQGQMIRPFLCVGKRDILEYAQSMGIPHVEDSTNADNRYTRNYIRNVLLPAADAHLKTDTTAALNRLSVLAERDGAFLNKCAEQAFGECAAVTGDQVELELARLQKLDEAIAARVIRLACRKLGVLQDVEFAHIESVLRLAACAQTGSRANLSGGLFAEVEYDRLLVGHVARQTDYSFSVRVALDGKTALPDGGVLTVCETGRCEFDADDMYTEYFDMDKIPGELVCRTRQTGDTIHPLGSPGKKKLKDYFIDKKLPRRVRDRLPLVAAGNEIVWAIGHAIGERYRVDEKTRRYMRMTYSKRTEDV
ncbi:MAG: tRNA lysidine(34) synthetase TilS [Christensenellaceae bacterium]|jgi:tRNA(Ile)-lysidine synthase